MRIVPRLVVLSCLVFASYVVHAKGQTLSAEIKSKVDAVVTAAYQSATAKFPCKLKTSGKMLSWQGVAKCVNVANDSVDWDGVSEQLRAIKKEYGLPAADISELVESSLAAHTFPFEKVFTVKEKKALLPLSSSLLKFLPEGSLQDLPVIDKSGKQVGTFYGVYIFEKIGEFSGKLDRHRLFQYKDSKGEMHASPERLLLDPFGVPWKDAGPHPGFRLTADQILLK